MSETKFTPGPWHVKDYGDRSFCIAASLFEDGNLNGWVGEGNDRSYMCVHGPIGHANAALIAAAPDLYEALRDLCEMGGPDDGGCVIEKGLAALRKARGET